VSWFGTIRRVSVSSGKIFHEREIVCVVEHRNEPCSSLSTRRAPKISPKHRENVPDPLALFGHHTFLVNCFDWALGLAGSTIDAFVGVRQSEYLSARHPRA
jgi:hypothetical protein